MTVKIHGKDYITVAERMELMRQSEKPFEIVESMPVQVGDRCVWRVAILLGGDKFYGSAECHFNAKPGTADATDPFACAETSAIGRALGFAGYGAVESIASADEVARTQENEPAQPTNIINAPTSSQLRKMFASIGKSLDLAQKLTFKGVIKPEDNLTPEECHTLKQVYDNWKRALDEKAKTA